MRSLAQRISEVNIYSEKPLYNSLNRISEAWSDFLTPIFPDPGSWYITMTFRDHIRMADGRLVTVHPETADKAWLRMVHTLNRDVFGVRYYKRKQGVIWAQIWYIIIFSS